MQAKRRGPSGEIQPSPPEERLADNDVRAVIRLVAEASILSGDASSRRRALLDRVATLAGADNWLWIYARVSTDLERWRPVPIKYLECGRVSMRQGAWFALRQLGAFGRPPEARALQSLTIAGDHFTRSMGDLIGQDKWAADPDNVAYRRRVRMDDMVFSTVPVRREGDQAYFSVALFGKGAGRGHFSLRDQKIIHFVVQEVAWLHQLDDAPAPAPAVTPHDVALAALSEREQQLVPLLASELRYAEIGEILGLTENTVKTYAARIFRALNATDRNDLRTRFSLKDLG